MELDDWLPWKRRHATCPFFEPHESIRRQPILCLRSALILFLYLGIGPRNDNFPSCFLTKILHKFLFPTTCVTGRNLIILDLSIRVTFGKEKKKSRSCSLCNFPSFYLHSLSFVVAFSSAFYPRTPATYILPFHFPFLRRFEKPVPIRGLV